MARYFFDSNDGSRAIRDEIGVDLASLDEVKSMARDFLFDLGHADQLNDGMRVFTVAVRDEQGGMIARGSMALAGCSH